MESIETKHKSYEPSKSTATPNRVVLAAAHIGQANILLRQESRGLLSGRNADQLQRIAEALAGIVDPLQRIGRALGRPQILPERIPPQFAPENECVSVGGLQ
jgi:hypothetical protein